MKDVTFGQYYPAKSFVHKMDPRAKIVFTLAYIVFIFFVKNFWGFWAAATYLALAIGMAIVGLFPETDADVFLEHFKLCVFNQHELLICGGVLEKCVAFA